MSVDVEFIKMIVQVVIIVVSFFVGRYILPKVNTSEFAATFQVILNYAESFVAYARQFVDASGEEKMDTVVEKLKAICKEQGIKVDDETLKAIAQKAYDAMKAGENSSKVVIEGAVDELRMIPVVTSSEVLSAASLENTLTESVSISDDEESKDNSETVEEDPDWVDK